ncbi:MAG TPA: PQQ-dependent sugar dehydrogenase [Acidimicrobiales bacterium]|nr:PQQ-dependent sugar dehydrogenase [Acidimicrobiales bacterium]
MGRGRVLVLLAAAAVVAAVTTLPSARATVALKATKVQTLTQPVAMAVRPGEPNAVYIAQKTGAVRRLLLGSEGSVTLDSTVVLNLQKATFTNGAHGLLGLAFNPAGTYLYTVDSTKSATTQLAEFPFKSGRAVKKQQRVLLDIPVTNKAQHLGGNVAFGPDGLLYLSTGDGGVAGATTSPAQDLTSLLGKVLRIDPKPSATLPYTIPAANPFVGRSDARGEIFHLGLRNPWKWSFDRATGDQWIADVGENSLEEVDHLASGVGGANFGWNLREGTQPYNGGAKPAGNVDPVYEYSHKNGDCSITGGYVYRGTAIAGLAGNYVFSDYCGGVIHALHSDGIVDSFVTVSQPVSFGEDAHGELWVLSIDGSVYRLDPA